MRNRIHIENGRTTLPTTLWDRITDLLGDNLVAWEGEENSVKEEHEDLIAELQDLDEALAHAVKIYD